MMDDAEPRAYESAGIEWKYSTAGAGQRERDPIQPAPVRLEFPEFPGGANVFHSQFFEAIKCPVVAVR
jgi:hypothetical protein